MSSANRRMHNGPCTNGDGCVVVIDCSAWSPLGTSWTGWVRLSIPDGHLLLSWRTPLVNCSRLHCWSSHKVDEWLEPVLPLCLGFCRSATDLLYARLCQMSFLKSMKLWNRLCWCCRCFSMMTRLWKICSTVLHPGLSPSLLWAWKQVQMMEIAKHVKGVKTDPNNRNHYACIRHKNRSNWRKSLST